jgi:hypothetical protein
MKIFESSTKRFGLLCAQRPLSNMSVIIRIESTASGFFKMTNLRRSLNPVSAIKYRSTSGLPTDAFTTDLPLHNYRVGFIDSDTAVFGWLKDNEGRYFIAVDTHIQSVANRTGYAKGKILEETEQAIIPPNKTEFMYDLHHWLILHGRYRCITRKPGCDSCIIEDL